MLANKGTDEIRGIIRHDGANKAAEECNARQAVLFKAAEGKARKPDNRVNKEHKRSNEIIVCAFGVHNALNHNCEECKNRERKGIEKPEFIENDKHAEPHYRQGQHKGAQPLLPKDIPHLINCDRSKQPKHDRFNPSSEPDDAEKYCNKHYGNCGTEGKILHLAVLFLFC